MRHFISTDAVVVVGIDMKNETTNVLSLILGEGGALKCL